jgi:hypothetical protein
MKENEKRVKEKRKTAWWGMKGDPETGGPMGQGGDWIL